MDYTYSYLITSLIYLFFWVVFFILEKDLRKPMLGFSLFFAVVGLPLELIYLQDWWSPQTITGTLIGIEDFLLIFSMVGISMVSYKTLARKKVSEGNKDNQKIRNRNLIAITIGTLVIAVVTFYPLGIHSFYGNLLASILPIGLLWWSRRDLIVNSLVAGAALLIISIIAFPIIDLITPGWVEAVWQMQNLSGIVLFRATIEDLIWFFMVGVAFSSVYEWWKGAKLISKKVKV